MAHIGVKCNLQHDRILEFLPSLEHPASQRFPCALEVCPLVQVLLLAAEHTDAANPGWRLPATLVPRRR
jgi:hypothetical protein